MGPFSKFALTLALQRCTHPGDDPRNKVLKRQILLRSPLISLISTRLIAALPYQD